MILNPLAVARDFCGSVSNPQNERAGTTLAGAAPREAAS